LLEDIDAAADDNDDDDDGEKAYREGFSLLIAAAAGWDAGK